VTGAIAMIGWLGAVSLLAAYLLLLRGRISAHSGLYLALNFAGSAGLAISTSAAHAWPSAAVNVVWLVIGVGPLVRAAAHRRAHRNAAATER
jgi:predicted short-subunit dehydrogenase-like oxidoreductase (DUF2520 family)